MWLFNFNTILKAYVKNIFTKTAKKSGDFSLLNKMHEPYKVPSESLEILPENGGRGRGRGALIK